MSEKVQPVFQLKILSPDNKFYQGEAISLSATNQIGNFDILASHANFFTLLLPGTVRIKTSTSGLDIPITSGIVRVFNNNVTLFVNI